MVKGLLTSLQWESWMTFNYNLYYIYRELCPISFYFTSIYWTDVTINLIAKLLQTNVVSIDERMWYAITMNLEWILFYLATDKASCLQASNQGTNGFKSFPRDYAMRIKCLAQGHYCRCQQIRTGDLTIESSWSYPLSHNSSSYIATIWFIPEGFTPALL